MKLLWLTDLHLEAAHPARRREFFERLRTAAFDAVVVTGDIAEPGSLCSEFLELGKTCHPRKVYFVLGNHDVQGRDKRNMDEALRVIGRLQPNLIPLGERQVVPLSARSALIGHQGAPDTSAESAASAAYFRDVLPWALTRFSRVFLATHVPPFTQAVKFSGCSIPPHKRKHFANRAAGRVIAGIARQFPQKQLTVISGHTHCPTRTTISRSVEILVGGCRKGYPDLQEIIEVP